MNILDSEMFAFFVKMAIAVGVALIIGLERELTGHKGSIKVNVLICLGSCIFISYESLLGINDGRLSANIITGVGFLCSGFIMRNGMNVNGLSTAATLWCSAGIGMLVANEHFLEALGLAIMIFILNIICSKIFNNIKPLKSFDDTRNDVSYQYNIVCLKEISKDIRQTFLENLKEDKNVSLESFKTSKITEDKVRVTILLKFSIEDNEKVEQLESYITDLEGVLSSGWEKIEE